MPICSLSQSRDFNVSDFFYSNHIFIFRNFWIQYIAAYFLFSVGDHKQTLNSVGSVKSERSCPSQVQSIEYMPQFKNTAFRFRKGCCDLSDLEGQSSSLDIMICYLHSCYDMPKKQNTCTAHRYCWWKVAAYVSECREMLQTRSQYSFTNKTAKILTL